MNTFNLKVVTPKKTFFNGKVTQVTVRTTEGDVGILAHHIDYCAIIPAGDMKVKFPDGTVRDSAIANGTIKVTNGDVIILANSCEWADEIDIQWARRSEEDARQKLQQHLSDQEFKYADLKLKRALNRISVSNSNNK